MHTIILPATPRRFSVVLNAIASVTLSRFLLAMDIRWRKFAKLGMIVKISGYSGLHPKPPRQQLRECSQHRWHVKNCRRSSRSCTFAWTSCFLLVQRVTIVRPSCAHPVDSCAHRLNFVWASATPGIFSTRSQYDGHTELADGLGKATRRREAFA